MTGGETALIEDAVRTGKLSGNGKYTQLCHRFFENRYGFGKCLLTTSCTDALEMCATLAEAGPGTEVIMPSFTFVSCANAFARNGAEVVFADCLPGIPNIDPDSVAQLITDKTRAIVVMHYGGYSCDMDRIMQLARRHNLLVIEDAAHAIDATYNGQPLGSIGDLATFSFHETKNIQCGEGGMLVINRSELRERAEIIWEKGTNRAAFFRGEVDKYTWVDTGSSHLPGEVTAAFLYGQLQQLDAIQQQRLELVARYQQLLTEHGLNAHLSWAQPAASQDGNGHVFYVQCKDETMRNALLAHLNAADINAVFHYLPLHLSPYYLRHHERKSLPTTEHISDTLLRLPMHFELASEQQTCVVEAIADFFAE